MCDRGEVTGKVCSRVYQPVVSRLLTDVFSETLLPEPSSLLAPITADAVATSHAGTGGDPLAESLAALSRPWLTQPSSPVVTGLS